MLKILKMHEEKFIPVMLCIMGIIMLGAISLGFVFDKSRQREMDEELALNDKKNLISVYIGGEVVNPGDYSLKEGARIGDAIEAAGGFTEEANQKINIAFTLNDGEKVIVVDKSQSPNGAAAYMVNINTATESELMSLDGVGEKIAQRIISYRLKKGGFSSADEMLEIPGIGEKLYENIKDLIVIE